MTTEVKINEAEIAERLKKLREDAGMTQAEIGKIAGVSNKAVWRWEMALSVPKMGAIQRLSDRFNVPMSWIIEGKDYTIELEHHLPKELAKTIEDFSEAEIEELNRYAMYLKMMRTFKR